MYFFNLIVIQYLINGVKIHYCRLWKHKKLIFRCFRNYYRTGSVLNTGGVLGLPMPVLLTRVSLGFLRNATSYPWCVVQYSGQSMKKVSSVIISDQIMAPYTHICASHAVPLNQLKTDPWSAFAEKKRERRSITFTSELFLSSLDSPFAALSIPLPPFAHNKSRRRRRAVEEFMELDNG